MDDIPDVLRDGWMAEAMENTPDAIIHLNLKRREDGGLRIWSDDVPGLMLSGKDESAVLRDVGPALAVLFEQYRKLIT